MALITGNHPGLNTGSLGPVVLAAEETYAARYDSNVIAEQELGIIAQSYEREATSPETENGEPGSGPDEPEDKTLKPDENLETEPEAIKETTDTTFEEDLEDIEEETETDKTGNDQNEEELLEDELLEDELIQLEPVAKEEEKLLLALALEPFPDENKHSEVPRVAYKYNALDLHDYKYFKIYEYETKIALGEGEMTSGGGNTGTYKSPLIPDGRMFVL
jgi:hypothetical protein